MSHSFELLLFSTDPTFIRSNVAAGVDTLLVDLEFRGKERRQESADTEINRNTVWDLRRVRACTDASVICRINESGDGTRSEVESVVDAGANEILLPMVRTAAEVEQVLDWVKGRCGVGILVETLEAVQRVAELSALPLARVYVGLNDLGLARGTPNIFQAVADGTVDEIRSHVRAPFGFGGLTLPDRGEPIPCKLLIGEMARLGCAFSFLRRSFCRDMEGRDPATQIPRIRQALERAHERSDEEIDDERVRANAAFCSWQGGLFRPPEDQDNA